MLLEKYAQTTARSYRCRPGEVHTGTSTETHAAPGHSACGTLFFALGCDRRRQVCCSWIASFTINCVRAGGALRTQTHPIPLPPAVQILTCAKATQEPALVTALNDNAFELYWGTKRVDPHEIAVDDEMLAEL